MATTEDQDTPPAKRRKLDQVPNIDSEVQSSNAKSLDRPISPPLSRRRSPTVSSTTFTPTWGFKNVQTPTSSLTPPLPIAKVDDVDDASQSKSTDERYYVPSPIQMTRIRDLAPHQNIDTVGLGDILGDPMIKECWNFNYLFDLDFVMQQLDSDVRNMVQMKIVHGFWKKTDERRIAMLKASERFPNVELLSAYMPDPFGTHHSKMLILFRHDDLAQVVIHTANMISRDWTNMTQAVWSSPLLPLSAGTPTEDNKDEPSWRSDKTEHPIGSGERFKTDVLRYLGAYESRTSSLTKQLARFDFSAIRAAFIGSAPSRQQRRAAKPSRYTSLGWPGLQQILSSIPCLPRSRDASPHIVVQVSSIATLGAKPDWISNFRSVLARQPSTQVTTAPEPSASTLTNATTNAEGKQSGHLTRKAKTSKFNIIFPTPDEIRSSLDGYAAGASIHTKLQSTQQQKQLEYLRPLLCHWGRTSSPISDNSGNEAQRNRAAPHIKTYIRFSDSTHKTIDWAMMTSANLSKQAWGDVVNHKDEIWIQSWEAGIVVWPALFSQPGQEGNGDHGASDAVMVPLFGRDTPVSEDNQNTAPFEVDEKFGEACSMAKTVVGFRMPYDLPLTPYSAKETPWCATMSYQEPDWKGQPWNGY